MKRKPGIGLPIKNYNELNNSKNEGDLIDIEMQKSEPTQNYQNKMQLSSKNIGNHSSSLKKMQEMKVKYENEFLNQERLNRKSLEQSNNKITSNYDQISSSNSNNPLKNELVFSPNHSALFSQKNTYTNKTYILPSQNAPSYEEIKKKQHKNHLPIVAISTLLLVLAIGGLWYNGYISQITSYISFANTENGDLNSKANTTTISSQQIKITKYEDCVKSGGIVENIQKVDGCTIDGNLFVKEIGIDNWNELVKIKKDSLQNNIIPFTPINLTELTTFRVGKDLNKDLLVGNTVYSANINNNSEAYGLMYITSPKFGLKPEGREDIFNKFKDFLNGGSFDTNFNKLIATDPDTLNKKQVFLMELPNLNKDMLSKHFNPTKSKTILVKESTDSIEQVTLQIWMDTQDSIILLEENFSKTQNKIIIDEIIKSCKNLEDLNCINNTINGSPEFKKYIENLSAGLINKFQIK